MPHNVDAGMCGYCRSSAQRLYALPERVAADRHVSGPVCYFCFVRRAGIRPTQRRIVWEKPTQDVSY